MPMCTLKELSAAVIIPHVLLALKWYNYTKSIVLFLFSLNLYAASASPSQITLLSSKIIF